MPLPSYFLTRPDLQLDSARRDSFDRLYRDHVANGTGTPIEYTLDAPRWQFLSYLGDTKNLLFHGSGNPEIELFEPRQSNDTLEFGNQRAVYASSDPLWAAYFAIVDRDRYVTSLVNSCIRVTGPGPASGPHYFFSINSDALAHNPWRTGTIYILPNSGFEQQQPTGNRHGLDVELAHWRSFNPVKPLARITIEPEEFPFLADIRGHTPQTVRQRALANPDGFPWLDE